MRRFLLGLAGVLCLVACSPSPSHQSSTIRIRWPRDPENLDPLVAPNSHAVEVLNLLHCSLLSIDYTQKKFVPWLVEAMPVVRQRDSLTLVTYQLRPEAAWDNGLPVLASDVVFTLKAMNCPGLPNEASRAQYGFIQNIEPDPSDERRFTLSFRGRARELVHSSGDYPILPEHQLDPQKHLRRVSLATLRADTVPNKRGQQPAITAFVQRYQRANLNRHPENLAGCGPYKLVDWQTDRYVALQRKPGWWGDRVKAATPQLQANPAAIDYEIIADEATAVLALRRGDIDLYPMMPAKDFLALRQSKAATHLRFYTADSYEMIAAGFNTRRPELQDARTRQALSYLFDIPGLIQASQQGMAYPSVSLVSPAAGESYHDSLPLLTFNTQRAQNLLRSAGWQQQAQGWTRRVANGTLQHLKPSISYRAGNPAYEAIALQFRTAAARIGIPVQPRPTEASLFMEQLQAGNVEMYLQVLSGNPFTYNFTPILHSQSIGWGNFTGFGTAASDQLIEAIATEGDPKRQAHLLRKFQYLLRQQCPLVVLYFLQYRLAATNRLTNLHATGIRPGYEAAAIQSQPAGTIQP